MTLRYGGISQCSKTVRTGRLTISNLERHPDKYGVPSFQKNSGRCASQLSQSSYKQNGRSTTVRIRTPNSHAPDRQCQGNAVWTAESAPKPSYRKGDHSRCGLRTPLICQSVGQKHQDSNLAFQPWLKFINSLRRWDTCAAPAGTSLVSRVVSHKRQIWTGSLPVTDRLSHVVIRHHTTISLPGPGGSAEWLSLADWKRNDNETGDTLPLEDRIGLLKRWSHDFANIYNGRTVHIPQSVLSQAEMLDILSLTKENIPRSWGRLVAGLEPHERHILWQDVMLWALQNRLDKSADFLDVTISDPSITAARFAVQDALKFIISACLEEQGAEQKTIATLHRLLCTFAESSVLQGDHYYQMSQKMVYLVLRHSDNHQAQYLFKVLLTSRSDIHPNSLLHFMDRFTHMGRPDLAMDALRMIVACGADVSHETVQLSCITLLRFRFDDVEWYRIQSNLVTEMLELGIRPEIPMLNAMITNAVEASDYQTAHAIFQTARAHGIRRDTITYSILLKEAVQTLDTDLVAKVMHLAEEDGALPRNNELVFSLIATLLQVAQSRSTPDASSFRSYSTILQIYTRYCDTQPLKEIGIYVAPNTGGTKVGHLSQPSPKLLAIMIMSFIRLRAKPHQTEKLYHNYQSLVEQNHPLFALTALTDHLSNAFLHCLGRSRNTLKACTDVIRNMLEPPASFMVQVAQPTVRTWSILARAYFEFGNPDAGGRIIQKMRELGMEPSHITWNILISGYAAAQDVTAAVDTVKQMETAGFEVDAHTLKALTRVRDRKELLNALQNASIRSEQSLAQVAESYTQWSDIVDNDSQVGNAQDGVSKTSTPSKEKIRVTGLLLPK
ncbi:MAG: hypothetical protein Q9220_004277 [cf. Caloplaca sp. 1 TL-2023]